MRAATVLSVKVATLARHVEAECMEAFENAEGQTQITMRLRSSGEEVVMDMGGYRGIRSYLYPGAVREQATRQTERIFKSDCLPSQWAEVEKHCTALKRAMERKRENTFIAHPSAVGSDHGQTGSGQQTLHAYGKTWTPTGWPTVGRMRERKPESAADWSFHNRPTKVGSITFDTTTMVPTDVCAPQGTWTATVRHGQATIHQHPRPWHRKTLKPQDDDVTMDGAQLAVLLKRGATLPEVVEACERQEKACAGQEAWAKVLSSKLGTATRAHTWWGCTPLTWDPHFPRFVSPDDEDAKMGARRVEDELGRVDTDTIIMLDAFPSEHRQQILEQLGRQKCSRWVVISTEARTKSKTRRALEKVGQEVESIVKGQLGTQMRDAGKAAWRTGDARVGKFDEAYSVWIGGKGEHVNAQRWEEAWEMEYQYAPPFQALSKGGKEYWRARQDGAYLSWVGTVAATDGSAPDSMGAAAVLRAADGEVTVKVNKVGGPTSSFRAEAAAMWQAVETADKTAPLVILTDSMNVIQALQAWDRAEFVREMDWQRNADVLQKILLAVNQQSSPITIVKVKSHRGVDLNERADILAGAAVGAEDEEVDTIFTPPPPDAEFEYK